MRNHPFRSTASRKVANKLVQDEAIDKVTIPISRLREDRKLQAKNSKAVVITYQDHALELGFAFTVWKVRGLAFDKVILWLEPAMVSKR